VGVRVDEAGHHRPPGEVDERGGRPGGGPHVLVAAGQPDPPVPDRHRRRDRAGRVHGDDPAAVQDQVGGAAVALERRGHRAVSAGASGAGALTPPRQ
jgi:hypothetical protein